MHTFYFYFIGFILKDDNVVCSDIYICSGVKCIKYTIAKVNIQV